LHVTDDVLLMAKAAIGPVEPTPVWMQAERIRGWVLADCCRFYEFRVVSIDESEQRVRIEAEVVHAGRRRDFFGFNRATHAVVAACPPEHTGLGVGTQLSRAVARAVCPGVPAVELARLAGRGNRSAIGVYGFEAGGFLVDGGKRDDAALAPLMARVDFPGDWR